MNSRETNGRTGVAAIGDVLDISTWSNIPYHFYRAGHNSGLFQEPWRLHLPGFRLSRWGWNARRILMGNTPGGYQFSKEFLEKAEGMIPASFMGSTVISFNQLFPRAETIIRSNGKIYYYIDVTLHDLFNQDQYGIQIPDKLKVTAIEQEKQNYASAEKVVVMGNWIRPTLLQHYQLPASKVVQILPGANMELSPDFMPEKFQPGAGVTRKMRLGFIGKDWKRKGLPFLMNVRDELAGRGWMVEVVVIGNFPDELSAREGLTYTGFIDKQKDQDKFITTLASCDFGCLFSESEALGISVLEFLRLGIPVMGFFHQGLLDTLIEGASLRFGKDETPARVADRLSVLLNNQQAFESIRNEAVRQTSSVTWENTVEKWSVLLKERN